MRLTNALEPLFDRARKPRPARRLEVPLEIGGDPLIVDAIRGGIPRLAPVGAVLHGSRFQ